MKELDIFQKSKLLQFVTEYFSDICYDKLKISELEKCPDNFLLLNSNNVLGLGIKDPNLKLLLIDFISEKSHKIPKLNHSQKDVKGYYTVNYLHRIFNFLHDLKIEGVEISTANDYPLTISTPYFEFILAPRSKEADN